MSIIAVGQAPGPWQTPTPWQVGGPVAKPASKGGAILKSTLIGGAAGAAGGALLGILNLPFLPQFSAPIGAAIGGVAGLVIGGIAGFLKTRNDPKYNVGQVGQLGMLPPAPQVGVNGLPPGY